MQVQGQRKFIQKSLMCRRKINKSRIPFGLDSKKTIIMPGVVYTPWHLVFSPVIHHELSQQKFLIVSFGRHRNFKNSLYKIFIFLPQSFHPFHYRTLLNQSRGERKRKEWKLSGGEKCVHEERRTKNIEKATQNQKLIDLSSWYEGNSFWVFRESIEIQIKVMPCRVKKQCERWKVPLIVYLHTQ